MITAPNMLDVPKALSENLKIIRDELGPDWFHFYHGLAPLLERFTSATDSDALERAANDVWQVCCCYPFVKGLVLGYGIGYSVERSAGRWRKLEAADFGDEMFVREIVNRFQSLRATLKETERFEGEQELTKREHKPIRYRGRS